MKSSQRAADLTKQLLAYSGKGRHFLQKAGPVVRSGADAEPDRSHGRKEGFS